MLNKLDREKAAFSSTKEWQGTIENCKATGEEWAKQIMQIEYYEKVQGY